MKNDSPVVSIVGAIIVLVAMFAPVIIAVALNVAG